jgi:outer membrane immunogenic protein
MKLRTVVLSAAAAFSFAAVATSACAGGSLKDDRPFSWTGFYVGGLLSYASGDSKHCDDLTCDKPSVVYPKHEMGGWLGGVTAGYNYQMGRVVAGVEVDWSWGKAEGSSPDTSGFGCLGLCSTSVESIGTIRGRLGYTFDRLLPYITAGVAYTEQHASIGSTNPISAQRTVTSFVGGGGFEYAFDRHWSAKVEYLFIKREGGDFAYDPGTGCGAPPGNCFARIGDIQTLRMGVNYKF